MSLLIILSSIAILSLLIASYTDIKTREVPDWLSYALIMAGIGIRGIYSFEEGWFVLLNGILGFSVMFLIACLLYYSRQWGGGDSKLLMGMGALIGITYPFDPSSLTLLWFFLSLLFIGAFLGLLWMVAIAVKAGRPFWASFIGEIRKKGLMYLLLTLLTIVLILATVYVVPLWPLIFFPLGITSLFIFVSLVEKKLFTKAVDPSLLTPGDWLAKEIVVKGRMVVRKKTLDEDDLSTLRKLAAEKKINRVFIKEGIPFVPSFLCAYIVVLLIPFQAVIGWIF